MFNCQMRSYVGSVLNGQGLSRKWILISLAVFIGVEAVLGGLVGQVVLKGFVSCPLGLRIEILLMLASYLEPAIAAFLAVALTLYGVHARAVFRFFLRHDSDRRRYCIRAGVVRCGSGRADGGQVRQPGVREVRQPMRSPVAV